MSQVSFQAKWDATNEHLKDIPEERGCGSSLQPSWITRMARFAILPAASISNKTTREEADKFRMFWYGPVSEKNRWARLNFTAETHKVATPDGAVLSAVLLRHRDNPSQTQISFMPNMALSKGEIFPKEMPYSVIQEVPSNFVLFDYRSVGESTGTFQKTNDLILDGSSIVQWVHEGLKIPKDKIRFYGRSLGGAVAVNTQALDPELTGRCANERSFASLADVIYSLCPLLLKPFVFLIQNHLKKNGLDLDAVGPFKKINAEKLVIFHRRDNVIPYNPSLAKKVPEEKIIELEAMPKYGKMVEQFGHHNGPLSCYYIKGTQESASEQVAKFILG